MSDRTLSDVGQGFLDGTGTDSPVLAARSFLAAVGRNVTKDPLTTRPVP